MKRLMSLAQGSVKRRLQHRDENAKRQRLSYLDESDEWADSLLRSGAEREEGDDREEEEELNDENNDGQEEEKAEEQEVLKKIINDITGTVWERPEMCEPNFWFLDADNNKSSMLVRLCEDAILHILSYLFVGLLDERGSPNILDAYVKLPSGTICVPYGGVLIPAELYSKYPLRANRNTTLFIYCPAMVDEASNYMKIARCNERYTDAQITLHAFSGFVRSEPAAIVADMIAHMQPANRVFELLTDGTNFCSNIVAICPNLRKLTISHASKSYSDDGVKKVIPVLRSLREMRIEFPMVDTPRSMMVMGGKAWYWDVMHSSPLKLLQITLPNLATYTNFMNILTTHKRWEKRDTPIEIRVDIILKFVPYDQHVELLAYIINNVPAFLIHNEKCSLTVNIVNPVPKCLISGGVVGERTEILKWYFERKGVRNFKVYEVAKHHGAVKLY